MCAPSRQPSATATAVAVVLALAGTARTDELTFSSAYSISNGTTFTSLTPSNGGWAGSPPNLFAVGEESAAALGVDAERTKRVVFLAASLLTGAAVAFAGVIGFVGLLVPHGVRAVAGNDQRTLLPLSALAGAALLVAADAVSRAALSPAELPIGAITAALGAPLFAWLLLRTP